MHNKISYIKKIIYLAFTFLFVFSCKTIEIKDKKSYKKINEKNIIINRDNCTSAIYINKETNKKLNGKYRIKDKYKTIYKTIVYASFIDGLFNGKHEKIHTFDNNSFYTKSHFIKGNKHGIEEKYINNILYNKCNYVNNMKQGKEYRFKEKNGDTLDVITHYYNPNYTKPDFFRFYFSEIEEQKINEIRSRYRHSTFIGKLKLEEGNTYYSLTPGFNRFFYLPNNCKKNTCIIEINGVYYLGIANFVSLRLYKLDKQP